MRHRDWHQALDDLLEEVDKALKSKEKLAETDAPPIVASDGPEVGTKGQGEVASELATSDFSNFNTNWPKAPMENVQVDPPEFSESNKRATRSMSSNSLLRQGAWEKRDAMFGSTRLHFSYKMSLILLIFAIRSSPDS